MDKNKAKSNVLKDAVEESSKLNNDSRPTQVFVLPPELLKGLQFQSRIPQSDNNSVKSIEEESSREINDTEEFILEDHNYSKETQNMYGTNFEEKRKSSEENDKFEDRDTIVAVEKQGEIFRNSERNFKESEYKPTEEIHSIVLPHAVTNPPVLIEESQKGNTSIEKSDVSLVKNSTLRKLNNEIEETFISKSSILLKSPTIPKIIEEQNFQTKSVVSDNNEIFKNSTTEISPTIHDNDNEKLTNATKKMDQNEITNIKQDEVYEEIEYIFEEFIEENDSNNKSSCQDFSTVISKKDIKQVHFQGHEHKMESNINKNNRTYKKCRILNVKDHDIFISKLDRKKIEYELSQKSDAKISSQAKLESCNESNSNIIESNNENSGRKDSKKVPETNTKIKSDKAMNREETIYFQLYRKDAKSSNVPDVKNTHDSEINYNDDSHESKQKLLVTKTDGCEINQIKTDSYQLITQKKRRQKFTEYASPNEKKIKTLNGKDAITYDAQNEKQSKTEINTVEKNEKKRGRPSKAIISNKIDKRRSFGRSGDLFKVELNINTIKNKESLVIHSNLNDESQMDVAQIVEKPKGKRGRPPKNITATTKNVSGFSPSNNVSSLGVLKKRELSKVENGDTIDDNSLEESITKYCDFSKESDYRIGSDENDSEEKLTQSAQKNKGKRGRPAKIRTLTIENTGNLVEKKNPVFKSRVEGEKHEKESIVSADGNNDYEDEISNLMQRPKERKNSSEIADVEKKVPFKKSIIKDKMGDDESSETALAKENGQRNFVEEDDIPENKIDKEKTESQKSVDNTSKELELNISRRRSSATVSALLKKNIQENSVEENDFSEVEVNREKNMSQQTVLKSSAYFCKSDDLQMNKDFSDQIVTESIEKSKGRKERSAITSVLTKKSDVDREKNELKQSGENTSKEIGFKSCAPTSEFSDLQKEQNFSKKIITESVKKSKGSRGRPSRVSICEAKTGSMGETVEENLDEKNYSPEDEKGRKTDESGQLIDNTCKEIATSYSASSNASLYLQNKNDSIQKPIRRRGRPAKSLATARESDREKDELEQCVETPSEEIVLNISAPNSELSELQRKYDPSDEAITESIKKPKGRRGRPSRMSIGETKSGLIGENAQENENYSLGGEVGRETNERNRSINSTAEEIASISSAPQDGSLDLQNKKDLTNEVIEESVKKPKGRRGRPSRMSIGKTKSGLIGENAQENENYSLGGEVGKETNETNQSVDNPAEENASLSSAPPGESLDLQNKKDSTDGIVIESIKKPKGRRGRPSRISIGETESGSMRENAQENENYSLGGEVGKETNEMNQSVDNPAEEIAPVSSVSLGEPLDSQNNRDLTNEVIEESVKEPKGRRGRPSRISIGKTKSGLIGENAQENENYSLGGEVGKETNETNQSVDNPAEENASLSSAPPGESLDSQNKKDPTDEVITKSIKKPKGRRGRPSRISIGETKSGSMRENAQENENYSLGGEVGKETNETNQSVDNPAEENASLSSAPPGESLDLQNKKDLTNEVIGESDKKPKGRRGRPSRISIGKTKSGSMRENAQENENYSLGGEVGKETNETNQSVDNPAEENASLSSAPPGESLDLQNKKDLTNEVIGESDKKPKGRRGRPSRISIGKTKSGSMRENAQENENYSLGGEVGKETNETNQSVDNPAEENASLSSAPPGESLDSQNKKDPTDEVITESIKKPKGRRGRPSRISIGETKSGSMRESTQENENYPPEGEVGRETNEKSQSIDNPAEENASLSSAPPGESLDLQNKKDLTNEVIGESDKKPKGRRGRPSRISIGKTKSGLIGENAQENENYPPEGEVGRETNEKSQSIDNPAEEIAPVSSVSLGEPLDSQNNRDLTIEVIEESVKKPKGRRGRPSRISIGKTKSGLIGENAQENENYSLGGEVCKETNETNQSVDNPAEENASLSSAPPGESLDLQNKKDPTDEVITESIKKPKGRRGRPSRISSGETKSGSVSESVQANPNEENYSPEDEVGRETNESNKLIESTSEEKALSPFTPPSETLVLQNKNDFSDEIVTESNQKLKRRRGRPARVSTLSNEIDVKLETKELEQSIKYTSREIAPSSSTLCSESLDLQNKNDCSDGIVTESINKLKRRRGRPVRVSASASKNVHENCVDESDFLENDSKQSDDNTFKEIVSDYSANYSKSPDLDTKNVNKSRGKRGRPAKYSTLVRRSSHEISIGDNDISGNKGDEETNDLKLLADDISKEMSSNPPDSKCKSPTETDNKDIMLMIENPPKKRRGRRPKVVKCDIAAGQTNTQDGEQTKATNSNISKSTNVDKQKEIIVFNDVQQNTLDEKQMNDVPADVSISDHGVADASTVIPQEEVVSGLETVPKKRLGRPRKSAISITTENKSSDIEIHNETDSVFLSKRRRQSRFDNTIMESTEEDSVVSEKSNMRRSRNRSTKISEEIDNFSDEQITEDDEYEIPPTKKRKYTFKGGRQRGRGRPKTDQRENRNDDEYIPHHSQIREPSKPKRKRLCSSNQTQESKNLSCGKCGKEMPKTQWPGHNLLVHNNLAWLEGTPNPEYEKNEKLLKKILFDAIKKRKGTLICELCQVTKRSVLGLLSHLIFCGKDPEEMEALMATCPECGAVMKPSSMEYHERVHRVRVEKKTQIAASEIQLDESGNRMKRKAAEKAATKISEFNILSKEDLEDQNISPEKKLKMNYDTVKKWIQKPVLAKRIPNIILSKWTKNVNKGQDVSCYQPGCNFTSNSLDSIKDHYLTCNFKPQKHFVCKICKFKSLVENDIVDHALREHLTEDNEDEHLPVSDTESSESDEINDNEIKKEVKPEKVIKKVIIKDTNEFSNKMFKFLLKNGTCHAKFNKFFPEAFQWTLDFELENYKINLFEEYVPNTFELLNENNAREYLPEVKESMFMKTDKNNKSKSVSEWKKWSRFEGKCFQDIPTFFVGGPVWALAWLPIPTSLAFSEGIKQFVAISTHRNMETEYEIGKVYPGKNIIQIWDLGELNHKDDNKYDPKLAYAIVHEGGTVWCLDWCPSGCYQHENLGFVKEKNESRQMGLLAAACSDGSIRVYSLIFPDDLSHSIRETELSGSDSKYPIYKTEPILVLITNIKMYDDNKQTWQVTKLSWSKEHGHNIIVAGFSNGYVAIWDLSTTSPILKFKRDKTVYLSCSRHFCAHQHAITMITLVPQDNKRFLATGSLDRCFKFWDLEDVSTPKSIFKRSFVTDGGWLNNWNCAVLIYDDALSMNHSYSYCLPLREYTYKYYNILPTNSTNYGVGTSDFGNSIANGTLAGEVLAMFPQQLLYIRDMEKTLRKKRAISSISSIEVIDLHPVPETDKTPDNGKNKKSHKDSNKEQYKFMPSTYNEFENRYGLKFCDKISNFKDLTSKKLKHKKTLTCEMMQSVPIEQYPFMSANRVSWNPNAWSFLWLAVGYQNGFVRLMSFKSIAQTNTWNELLKSHITKVESKQKNQAAS